MSKKTFRHEKRAPAARYPRLLIGVGVTSLALAMPACGEVYGGVVGMPEVDGGQGKPDAGPVGPDGGGVAPMPDAGMKK